MVHRAFSIAMEPVTDTTSIEVDPITFTLPGDDYVYHAVDTIKEDAAALLFARLTGARGLQSIVQLEDSLRRILTPESFAHLIERVEDPADALRLSHLTQVALWLHDQVIQRAAGYPTESQSA